MLRTRPPRSTPEGARARLACIRHAASVDPEPGSNSPPMTPKGRCFIAHEASAPRRSVEPLGSRRNRTPPQSCGPRRGLVAACDGHALRSGWLYLLLIEPNHSPSPPAHPRRGPLVTDAADPLAPSSAHDAMSRGDVAAPRSSVRCASLSRYRAPLRSPQSLPHSPTPCQGRRGAIAGSCLRPSSPPAPGHPGHR